jgi:hypothetical protein
MPNPKKIARVEKRAVKKQNGNPGNPGTKSKRGLLKKIINTVTPLGIVNKITGGKKPSPAQVEATKDLVSENPVLKEVLVKEAGGSQNPTDLAAVMNGMGAEQRTQLVKETKQQMQNAPANALTKTATNQEDFASLNQAAAEPGTSGGIGGFIQKAKDVIDVVTGKNEREADEKKQQQRKTITILAVSATVIILLIGTVLLLKNKTQLV